MKIKHGVTIQRPIETVFAFLTNLDNERRWQPDIKELAWTKGDSALPGATFREVRKVMGRSVELICEVTELKPNDRFCIRTVKADMPFTSCRLFTPVDGGTRTVQATNVQLSGILKLMAPLIAPIARRQLAGELRRLKTILEAGG